MAAFMDAAKQRRERPRTRMLASTAWGTIASEPAGSMRPLMASPLRWNCCHCGLARAVADKPARTSLRRMAASPRMLRRPRSVPARPSGRWNCSKLAGRCCGRRSSTCVPTSPISPSANRPAGGLDQIRAVLTAHCLTLVIEENPTAGG